MNDDTHKIIKSHMHGQLKSGIRVNQTKGNSFICKGAPTCRESDHIIEFCVDLDLYYIKK